MTRSEKLAIEHAFSRLINRSAGWSRHGSLAYLLWESEFYEDGQTIGQRIAQLVKNVPVEDVARVAIKAKEEMRLRHVPLLLARELMRTMEGRATAKCLFPRVIMRPDDTTEFLAIYWKNNKDEPLAKQVKRWLGDTFRKFARPQTCARRGSPDPDGVTDR
jgi:60 kDa SS-A/Ro ribonucleoprotein